MARVTIEVKFNKLPAIGSAFKPAAIAGIQKGGFRAEGQAKARAAVDTGNMRNSIANEPSADGTSLWAHAEYSAFVDLGTSRMPAQPFFTPAVTEWGQQMPADIKAEIDGVVA